MGGTSFDASLIIDGVPSSSNETKIEGLPVQMSVVDIHVIGAGGGSVVWEEAGAVRVGPRSAGSAPGPICYGRGGDEPTVSDANLVLGLLDKLQFFRLGDHVGPTAAENALSRAGSRFGMDARAMAQGVLDIINAKMADAIRTITIRRGIDPRDFSLVAFGGAGPAQAVALADELEIKEVVVPVTQGAFSAWGMLQTDIRHDCKETCYGFWDSLDAADAERYSGVLKKKEETICRRREGVRERRHPLRAKRGFSLLRAGVRPYGSHIRRQAGHGGNPTQLRRRVFAAVRAQQP